jgi:hypothetical protein
VTRKDYILLSSAMRLARGALDVPSTSPVTVAARAQQHRADCEVLATALGERNGAFDRDRFLRDAGAIQ